MPEQRPEIRPVIGISVEISHGVEHSRLDGLPSLAE